MPIRKMIESMGRRVGGRGRKPRGDKRMGIGRPGSSQPISRLPEPGGGVSKPDSSTRAHGQMVPPGQTQGDLGSVGRVRMDGSKPSRGILAGMAGGMGMMGLMGGNGGAKAALGATERVKPAGGITALMNNGKAQVTRARRA